MMRIDIVKLYRWAILLFLFVLFLFMTPWVFSDPPMPPNFKTNNVLADATNSISTHIIFDLNYDVWYPTVPGSTTSSFTWVSIDTGLPQFSDVQFVNPVHYWNPSNQYPYAVVFKTNDNLVSGTWRNYVGHSFDWGFAWSHWWVGQRHYSVTNN